ncbi:protein-tyrosine kinase 6b [Chanos chanos]|uniref:Tyrosine-protein kinase n=1 Tax=Chanos chanos TaxID=29144 RepID=A0A6J2UVL4_CHACN|nr:protein-tyrosine kinase 6-like [Chanos chanos]
MGECLRKSCPCLKTLWDKIFAKPREDGHATVKEEHDRTSDIVDSITLNGGEESILHYAPHCPRQDKMIYRALWSFEARAEEELSFEAGDLFNVINSTGEWWTARKIDRNGCTLATGFVPYNYLEREESESGEPWYFGKMSRFEALSHLMTPENKDGSFLVRLSETENVGYVLSVKAENRAKHFKIIKAAGQFYVDPSRKFSSLQDLIEHYKTRRLASVDRLGQACIRKEPQPQDLSHSTVDDWELPKEEFTLERQLGKGHFADVYRGKWKDRVNVAIKVLKTEESLDQTEFQQEVQILKRLRHRHLISLFAICTASTPYYIITELMEKGDLLKLLRSEEGAALDRISLIDMAAQVADGMSYLEANNSIHRDLAARNVLVGEGYICKVADFGLARIIKEPFYTSEDKTIPYKWCAPEAISHGRYSNKSDVWSFGVLLYEMLTYGGIPYPAFSNREVYHQITENGYRMPAPTKCPQYVYDIMLACWRDNPEDRPDFKDLKPDLENVNRYSELE